MANRVSKVWLCGIALGVLSVFVFERLGMFAGGEAEAKKVSVVGGPPSQDFHYRKEWIEDGKKVAIHSPSPFAPSIDPARISEATAQTAISPDYRRFDPLILTSGLATSTAHSLSIKLGSRQNPAFQVRSEVVACTDCSGELSYLLAISLTAEDAYRVSLTVSTLGQARTWEIRRNFRQLAFRDPSAGIPGVSLADYVRDSIYLDVTRLGLAACSVIANDSCTETAGWP
ncbi:MAG: hypothetical protein IT548_19625 [Alphaproteobacteria bacterium]|nr:hypothetical protein [Alphaproteobacteria bacterium]